MSQIRANTVLPANRRPVTLHTADGLKLVGELALPADVEPVATIVMLHPLPTQGGMMDSHLFRKAANRLPALAGIAVLRFNTRGTSSEQGTSEGEYDEARGERFDVGFRTGYDFRAPEQFHWQNLTMRLRWLPTRNSLVFLGTSYNPNPLGLPASSPAGRISAS